MPSAPEFYPPNPAISGNPLKVSSAFKKEVRKVMGSILQFFIVYILLVILASLLAIGCAWLGIWIIITLHNFIAVMLGIGVAGLGVMVLIFLVKFIFAKKKYDTSGSIELKETDHPKLFAFVRQLCKDTETPFPKRIFLSPDVDACVFYDSNFWSMLFPVKKNLQIGLGLVNAVNISEFKAVIGHELGHFSQKSMKLGSFVYNVNQVIFNMLFENEAYARWLDSWANASQYFAIFAGITTKILQGIQWVLRQVYAIVNKDYMGLSRQMEFHADAVAATVAGSNNFVHALRRFDIAGSNYHTVLEKGNSWYAENLIIQNIYACQQKVAANFAFENNLQMEDHMPVVSDEFLSSFSLNRVNFQNQWASHPSIEERSAQLTKLNIEAVNRTDSSWQLFNDSVKLQEEFTAMLYKNAPKNENQRTISADEFEKKLKDESNFQAFPKEYHGFYDRREFTLIDVEQLSASVHEKPADQSAFSEIFSIANGKIQSHIIAHEEDMSVLSSIVIGDIETKTFDFAGDKYDKASAGDVSEKIRSEIEVEKQKLESLDKKSFQFFYGAALAGNLNLAEQYKAEMKMYFEAKKSDQPKFENFGEIFRLLQPLLSDRITIANLNEWTDRFKMKLEEPFKDLLKEHLDSGFMDSRSELKEKTEKFIASQYAYHDGQSVFSNELQELHSLIISVWQSIIEVRQTQFMKILKTQQEIFTPLATE